MTQSPKTVIYAPLTWRFTISTLMKEVIYGDKPLTLDELEKMLSDHMSFQLGKHDEAPTQNEKALLKNTVNIAKQLLSILKSRAKTEASPDYVTAEELEVMIVNYETYWDDRLGRGDRDAEEADVLPGKILWITSQLIETMKES